MHAYIASIHTDTYIHTYVRTCMHASIHPSIHTHTHTYIHLCMHTKAYTYIHTPTHTHTHTYIHTYINLNDAMMITLFSLFDMTLFIEQGMKSVDYIMADILVGTWFALSSIVMLNLFIALMSDTFQR